MDPTTSITEKMVEDQHVESVGAADLHDETVELQLEGSIWHGVNRQTVLAFLVSPHIAGKKMTV